MNIFGCNAARFGVGSYVVFVCRFGDKRSLCHCFSDHIAHLEESAPSLSEGEIDHLVGGIQHARYIASSSNRLVRQPQVREPL